MDEHILKYLNKIEVNDNNIFNGAIFICKENPNSNPCQNCLTCKIIILKNFSVSLLNHMTDNDVINFITKCSKTKSQKELSSVLQHILYPLNAKDRLYSLSRNVPSLNTDLSDFSIKNFTVDKSKLEYVTHRIANWISIQPDTFRIQFIISMLSHLKMSVLSEIYYSINNDFSKDNLNSNSIISNQTTINDSNHISYPDSLLKTINDEITKMSDNEIISEIKNKPIVDFISKLPVHISKRIINFLDDKSLSICSSVCENWKRIVHQVRKEDLANGKIKEQAMMLQSVSTIPADPRFARDTNVRVPQLDPHTHKIIYLNNQKMSENTNKNQIDNVNELELINSRKVFSMDLAYQDIMTKNLIIEERNVFCGSYSVMIILESQSRNKDPVRTISYNGGKLVAVSGANKFIQFLDKRGIQTDIMKNRIRGHTGSIKVVKLINKPNKIISGQRTYNNDNNISHEDVEILSGSYDTTIRRWDTLTGKCLKIYIGHSGTISDIDTGEKSFISGSYDGTCKLWRYDDKNSFATMRHKHPVTAVVISHKICVSGDSSGLIKVWNIQHGEYIKSLIGHFKEISAIKVDNWHILSASLDNFVMLWSTVGEFDTRIGSFHHPKSVISMEFLYLRAVTGCADGKIRIWNILNGHCIRIIRGNSRSDPILNLFAKGDTIIINTISNILVLNFEPIDWVYENDKKNKLNKTSYSINISENEQSKIKRNGFRHISQRCERSRLAGNIDPRIFITPTADGSEINSKCLASNPEFNYTRLFENGEPLTRSTAWLVSPSFNKTLSNTMKSSFKLKDTIESLDENKVITELPGNIKRDNIVPKTTRRISYGFERQDHLLCNTDLQEVKQTLRNHIRSPPQISADAMPEFIKTMVSQLNSSTLSGRPISAFSCNHSTRPSSGPSKIDSKSKVGVQEMKHVISPVTQQTSRDFEETVNLRSLSKNQINQHTNDENISKPLILSNFQTSSNSISQSKFGSFFIPRDYRKKLAEKKLEFDQKHHTSTDHLLKNDINENSKKFKCKLVVNNLNLQTFENSQQYLDQIEKRQIDYEIQQKSKADSEYHLKWLKKATDFPNLKFEKDAVMKRPRSAKI